MSRVRIEDIVIAHHNLKEVVIHTPLQYNSVLSERYGCNVYLKREDLQNVRSFKIRGAYHRIQSMTPEEVGHGVVCASAGNHAQGVAYACKNLKINGKIFMPKTTPRQKVTQVKRFGCEYVQVILCGDTFDDAYIEAETYCNENNMTFIHPFDDPKIIAGQGTLAMEIMDDMDEPIDYLFASIGGGGLIAGVGTYLKGVSPKTKLIGVEPTGAPAMKTSLQNKKVIPLLEIDKFVDGAAVKKVGEIPFQLCGDMLSDIILVPEGKVCTTILELYNENAIVAEPAGALPIAALQFYQEQIKGKNVVCVISGGNNDIGRMQEIKERSLIYEGLQHHFIINFPQRAGALRELLVQVLGPDDDIIRFEYTKKNNKDNGPALVGVELKRKEDYEVLIDSFKEYNIDYVEVNKDQALFNLLI